jgi:hypothetical protein
VSDIPQIALNFLQQVFQTDEVPHISSKFHGKLSTNVEIVEKLDIVDVSTEPFIDHEMIKNSKRIRRKQFEINLISV